MTYTYEKKDVLLDIQNVTVQFGDKVILRDFSAQVQNVVRPDLAQGQVVGLLGPSGIGKTTLFNVLSGKIQPKSGQILLGSPLTPTFPGRVGVVAQNYPLIDHRTILSNLEFAARQAKLADPKQSALYALQQFGLADHHDKYPSQVSGGQKQRAAIAQQMLCSDKFLVLDEPFSGLDVVAQHNVHKLIADMAQKHEENTFIVVTHDVTAAVAVCDTIWLMGRDRNPDGSVVPGARVMETYDLMQLGIAWRPDCTSVPQATQLIRDIKHRFEIL